MIKPLTLKVAADFIFLDGHLRREDMMPDKPLVSSISCGWPTEPQLMYALKQANADSEVEATYADLEENLECIYAKIAELGPFDGICCYSQGANIGAIVAGAAACGLIKNQPAFQFGWFFCGSEWGWAKQASAVKGHESIFPLRLPALIVQGSADPLGHPETHRRYDELFDARSSVKFKHSSGHIPFGADLYDTWQIASACRETVEAATLPIGLDDELLAAGSVEDGEEAMATAARLMADSFARRAAAALQAEDGKQAASSEGSALDAGMRSLSC